jgi:hypothetical protein
VVHAIVNAGAVTLVMSSVDDTPESVAAVMSGATVGAGGALVAIVTVRPGDAVEVLPAGSVSVNVTLCAPSARAGEAVIVTVPPTHTPVPADVPSMRSVTVFPLVHGMVNAGVVIEVRLSVFDEPLSLAAVMSGAVVGVAGAEVSIVMLRAGDTPDVFPAGSVSVKRTERVPSASVADEVMLADPATHGAVPAEAPSITNVTVLPVVQAIVNAGVVTDVMLSVDDVPLSVAAVMSGVAVGVMGAVVSMVTVRPADPLEVFPAGSVSVKVTLCAPSAIAGVAVMVTVPPTQRPVPAVTASIFSVTVVPVVHAIVNAGVVTEVRLSVFDVPLSVAAVRSGAMVGASGAVVSIVTVSAGDGAEVFPAGSISVNVIERAPSAIAVDAVIVTVPPTHTPVPAEVPSTFNVTVVPVVQVMVNAGVVTEVMLSVFDVPLSLAAVMSGATVGVAGAVVSIEMFSTADGADVFPAESVSVNVTV